MNIDEQIRTTLRDWAAEAPVQGLDAPRVAAPRASRRWAPLVATAAVVALAIVTAIAVNVDDDGTAQLQTTPAGPYEEAPSVLLPVGWNARGYLDAYQTIRSAPAVAVALDDIPDGVTSQEIEGVDVYVVRRGGQVLVLLAQSPLDGTRILYCQSSGWFESAVHGDKYDAVGVPANERAPRAMARVPARVEGDQVVVDFAGLTPGVRAADAPPPQPAAGLPCVTSAP